MEQFHTRAKTTITKISNCAFLEPKNTFSRIRILISVPHNEK